MFDLMNFCSSVYTVASTDNAKYVERGRMLAMHQDPGWEQELKSANCRKNGAPFLYAESLFVSIAIIRSMAQIPYRQLRGMVSEMMPGVPIPDHATMFRRIRDLSVQVMGSMVAVTARDGTRHMFYAVDTTGIKVANRREWINKKWKVRRGFIKMHALADTDTGLILSLKITDGSVGDSKTFVPLLNQALSTAGSGHSNNSKLNQAELGTAGSGQQDAAKGADAEAAAVPKGISILGDGAYASRNIHKECKNRGITPLIRLGINSTARGKGSGDAWGLAVRDQLGGSPVSPWERLQANRKRRTRKSGRVG